MAHTEWIGTVERLIEICKDGEHGYKEAARQTDRQDLQRIFETQSRARARFAEELRNETSRLTDVSVSGSLAAAVHRGWMDLLARLGGGDEGLLSAVRQGERRAILAYENAIRTPLPPQIEQLARRQMEEIKRAVEDLPGPETNAAA